MQRHFDIIRGSWNMTDSSNRYLIKTLRKKLKPFGLVWLPTVGSTNSWAADARRNKKLFAPAVVLTGRQTHGRGRGKNRYFSPPGVMTATFALPIHDSIPPNLVPLLAGLATRDAIRQVAAIDAGLKWPNDLYLEDRKLAGLLCERVDGADLIGIGINVNLDSSDLPKNLRNKSTSLRSISSNLIDMNSMVIELTRQLTKRLIHPEQSNSSALKDYARHHILVGKSIRVVEDGNVIEGRCDGIDQHGRLIILSGKTRHIVVSGSVFPA